MADWEKRYTDLVRILSHDLRAPLRHVVSFADLLLERRDEFDEKGQQCLDFVRDSGELAQAMLHEMLELSRIYQKDPTLEAIEIGSWTERYASKADLECRIEVAANKCVHADEERLARALEALVKNAQDFGGGASLRVIAGNGFVELRVEQAKNGLPEEKWEEACEPFGRVGGRPDAEHVGMGLPIALALTESFGGSLKQDEGGIVISLPVTS